MILEVCLFAESAVADVALVRPRSTMYVHVTFEVARCRKRLRAQQTLVGFLLKTHRNLKEKKSN
jgi:hypothetical protein